MTYSEICQVKKKKAELFTEFIFIEMSFLWTKLCPLFPDSHAKACTANVTIFGNRAWREVIIKVKLGHKSGILVC